jgi:hypothetical protein
VLTDALLGTKVVNVEDVGTHRVSVMVVSWVGNTTREENFLPPGSKLTVKLLLKESYSVDASRYIQSFGSMKHYTAANLAHQKLVKKLGFKATYSIPNLPL